MYQFLDLMMEDISHKRWVSVYHTKLMFDPKLWRVGSKVLGTKNNGEQHIPAVMTVAIESDVKDGKAGGEGSISKDEKGSSANENDSTPSNSRGSNVIRGGKGNEGIINGGGQQIYW